MVGSATTIVPAHYLASFLFLGACDVLLIKCGVKAGHWFALHALGNFYISAMTLSSLWRVFAEPDHAVYKPIGAPDEDWSNVAMLGAIHVYHMLRYSGLSAADWFHHLAFIPFNQLALHWPSLSGAWAAWGFKWGPVVHAQDFFVCGLPGGLDYLMLALVKEGRMAKTQHKHYQAKVNVWMRAPGIIATCAIHLFGLMRVWSAPGTPASAKVIGVLDVVLIGWNGLYYMERVVAATSKHMALSRDPTTGKEPAIEPICGASGTVVSVSRTNIFAPMQVDDGASSNASKKER